MNAFERLEVKRELLLASVGPTWQRFRVAVNGLVKKYNEIEEGRSKPARIVDPSTGGSIVILSDRGLSSDCYHSLSVVVTVSLESHRYVIKVRAEECKTNRKATHVSEEAFIDTEFVVECDMDTKETWLSHDGKERLTPQEAAESVIFPALMHEEYVPANPALPRDILKYVVID